MENKPATGKSSWSVSSKRPTIGYITSGSGFQEAAAAYWLGMMDEARAQDVNVVCFPGAILRSSDQPQQVTNPMNGFVYDLIDPDQIQGLIIWTSMISWYSSPQQMAEFFEQYRPLPIVSAEVPMEGYPCVLLDDYGGMKQAVNHLIEVHGLQQLAFIKGPEGLYVAQERYRGYVDALAEHHIPLDPRLVTPPDPFWSGEEINTLLDERGLRPGVDIQAIVGASTSMGKHALEIVKARGVRCPDDLALVTFDLNSDVYTHNPPLTAVDQQTYEVSRQCMRLVLAQLRGEPVPAQTVVPARLIIGQSCGCASQKVIQAAGDGLKTVRSARIGNLAEHTADILKALPPSQVVSAESVEAVLDTFMVEIGATPPTTEVDESHLPSQGFLRMLETHLSRIVDAAQAAQASEYAPNQQMDTWQAIISALRLATLPYLKGTQLAQANDLWQQAQTLVGEITLRIQVIEQVKIDSQTQRLRSLSQTLITTFDTARVMDTLAAALPGLGIPSAYLSLYANPSDPLDQARLMLAYTEKGRLPLEAEARLYPTGALLPTDVLPIDRPYSLVVQPLYFGESQLGLAIFELGVRQGELYEALRGEISSALMGALLVEKVEVRANQLDVAAKVSSVASSILEPNELIQQTVQLVRERFGLYYVGLFLLEATGQKAVLQAGTGEAGKQMLARGHQLEAGGDSMIGWCIANKQARIALDVGEDAVRFNNPLLPETRSELALPLISRGQVIGAMTIQSSQSAAFTREDVSTLQTLADQLANAIENARLFTERTRIEEALAGERFLLRTLIDSIPDQIFAKDIEGRFTLVNAAQARLRGITDPDELIGKSDFDFYPRELAEQYQASEQPILSAGQSMREHEEPNLDAANHETWTSTTKVPVRNQQGQIIGLVGVSRDVTERRKLMAEQQRRALQLQTVAEVSRVTQSILTLDNLLPQAANLVRERFNLYYVGIFMLDASGQWAALRAGTGEAGQKMVAAGHNLEAGGDSMIGWCIANKQARIALDVGEDAVHFNNPLLPGTRSELALPLISRGQVVGAMTVQSEREAAFTQDDVTVLQTMADQLANAIANARLFEQTQQRAVELSSAREIAEAARKEAEKARQEAEAEKETAEAAKEEAEKARQGTEAANRNLATQMWQTTGQALLNDRLRGEQDISTLARNVIQQVCEYIGAQIGALYVLEGDRLKLAGAYAYRRDSLASEFQIGEGLVGEAALGKRLIVVNVPDDYLSIASSSLGELMTRNVIFVPFAYDDQVIGVVEIGKLAEFTAAQMEFLTKALENIAVGFTTAQARRRVNELLAKTQQQASELQMQEEELRSANEELASQAENLRASEAKLRTNQVELESVNVELEEKASVLQEQRQVLDRQNQELRVAQQELKQKADDLAVASKYKSEFLANMSHELRTPLNSLLILAGMLAKNEHGNLTADQVESAQIIYSGGTDLLNLINDILDLSKVEAGKMEFRYTALPLARLVESMRAQFQLVAEGKGLEFMIRPADDLPETIETDQQRVEQIVKNLLSNAFKFTPAGCVQLQMYRPALDTDLSKSGLKPEQAVAIRVTDTGIGMTPEQQQIVFEAFQQADGGTSRQYGGTGLGLSISRELAMKLGGQIDLASEIGKGSQFTLYLPIARREAQADLRQTSAAPSQIDHQRRSQTQSLAATAQTIIQPSDVSPASVSLPDDRATLRAGDRVLLIIEDDLSFAEIVQDYGRHKNFKCLVAGDGQSGLKLAQRHKPDAIILDLNLPDISGWEVLDELKHNPDTLHIPVHIITGEEESLDAFKRGAMGFLTKPIGLKEMEGAFQSIEQVMARKIKSLLVVEDDDNLRKSVRKLLEGSDVTISEAGSGQAALALLETQAFDCMILDLTLPDMSGYELLNRLNGAEHLAKCPVIVYTGKALSEEENQELMKYADSVIVKGAKSPERLLDEAALFLHRVVADMPEEKQRMIKRLLGNEGVLAGKEILIVDDDARNAFALSKLLADKGLKVHIASNGEKALEALEKDAIDLVLMDIMLPGMDGYEITRRIRAQMRFRQLPILALTAKAMKGDREKCLEAGANDYLSKPVDAERLLSMLRVWLSRE